MCPDATVILRFKTSRRPDQSVSHAALSRRRRLWPGHFSLGWRSDLFQEALNRVATPKLGWISGGGGGQ